MTTELTPDTWTKDISGLKTDQLSKMFTDYERERMSQQPIHLAFSGKSAVYTASDGYRPPEGECVVSISHFFDGYICWRAGYVRDVIRRPILSREALPPIADLPDYGGDDSEGWRFQMGFMVSPRDDEGIRYFFATSSKSGVRAVRGLLSEITAQLGSGGKYVPVILFISDSFMAQGHKAYRPVFKIVDWI